MSGTAVDLETMPGDHAQIRLVGPEDGLLVHTNHFTTAGVGQVDVDLGHAGYRLRPRLALRLEVASSAFPR